MITIKWCPLIGSCKIMTCRERSEYDIKELTYILLLASRWIINRFV